MTITAPTLFDAPAAVRNTDPATSHAAAASLPAEVLSDQRRAVLSAVADVDRFNPHRPGATAYEVMCRMSYSGHAPQMNVVARRLRDLGDLGLAEIPEVDGRPMTRQGGSGRRQQVWVLTDAGREALRWQAVDR